MLKHLKSRDDWNEKKLGAKGFTLIELLVVIIILGILAAVAIFAIGGIRGNATKSACQTEVGTVETAIAAAMTADPGGAVPALSENSDGKLSNDNLPNMKKDASHVELSWVDTADGTVTDNCG